VRAGASTELFIVQWARGKGSSPGRVERSSRAMLATARLSCTFCRQRVLILIPRCDAHAFPWKFRAQFISMTLPQNAAGSHLPKPNHDVKFRERLREVRRRSRRDVRNQLETVIIVRRRRSPRLRPFFHSFVIQSPPEPEKMIS